MRSTGKGRGTFDLLKSVSAFVKPGELTALVSLYTVTYHFVVFLWN